MKKNISWDTWSIFKLSIKVVYMRNLFKDKYYFDIEFIKVLNTYLIQ